MLFDFATAGRIVFGAGTIDQAGTIVREFGTRALVVTGRDARRSERLMTQLNAAGVETTSLSIDGEPALAPVVEGARAARDARAEVVIGFGGGSALDAAKAVAALATNTAPVETYLEIIGAAQPLTAPPLPIIAIPTTAGTGSEVTRNAVLFSPDHRVKVSLRSALMLPRVALVDPTLSSTMPATVTASTGMDALTQLLEPYVSRRANPMIDAICVDGIRRAAGAIRTAVADPANAKAREQMALASLFSGMALANAGLGAVHGFAGPIGGMFNAPHGALCAALLPHVFAGNLQALRRRAPTHPSLPRFDGIAVLMTGRMDARADDGITWLSALRADLGVPALRSYGIRESDIPQIVAKAALSSSMKANPIDLTFDEMSAIVAAAL